MRCFKHIAALIRNKRLQHPKGYSQSELSHLLGYKNGQFISNVERALCNIPLKMLGKVSEVLNIDPVELKGAILRDHEETLENYLKTSAEAQVKDFSASRNSDLQKDADSTVSFSGSNNYKMSSNS